MRMGRKREVEALRSMPAVWLSHSSPQSGGNSWVTVVPHVSCPRSGPTYCGLVMSLRTVS